MNLGKPGSERIALLVTYQWAAVLAVMFFTDWRGDLSKDVGFWAGFSLLAFIVAVLADNMLPANRSQ